jgi:hypothetical protein
MDMPRGLNPLRAPSAPGSAAADAAARTAPGIRPSSGAWRKPAPLPDGRLAGGYIPELVARIARASAPWMDDLQDRWAEVLGPQFASHCRFGRYVATRRMLVIYVDTPVVQFEAARALRDLDRRIRAVVPAAPSLTVRFEYHTGEA